MSDNESSNRPSASYSLSRDILKKLAERASGPREKSAMVEKALNAYFESLDGKTLEEEKLREAVRYFINNHDTYGNQIDMLNHNIQIIFDRVGFLTSTIESLFGITAIKEEIDSINSSEFDGIYKDNIALYATTPELLNPKLEKENKELKDAAFSIAYDNLQKDVGNIIKSMPFMEDERFYVDYHIFGQALFDRKFQMSAELSGGNTETHFPVLSIKTINGLLSLTYPKTRPFFSFGRWDMRELTGAFTREEIVRTIPMIVADYLAFRKFQQGEPTDIEKIKLQFRRFASELDGEQ